jgi:hypothetical protein
MDAHFTQLHGGVNITVTHLRKTYWILKISQQPENCENRNDPDLVQAFLKKWWVENREHVKRWLFYGKLRHIYPNAHTTSMRPKNTMTLLH